jgi:hypothetical protein
MTQGSAQPFYGQPQNVGTFANLAGGTTTGQLVKTGEGALYSITFNTQTAAGVVTIYDGISTGGKLIATITVPASPQLNTLFYNVFFATGLFVVIATQTEDITISYK